MASPDTLRRRRAALGAAVRGPILLVAHEPAPRNFLANTYRFRQDSTFLYYLGDSTPGAAAVIDGDHTTLYLPPVDPADALWHGEVPGWAVRAAAAGVDAVAARDEVPETEYHALPLADPQGNAEASLLSGRDLDPSDPGTASKALLDAVIAQRLRLDDEEIAALRRALAVTAVAHREAMAATRPGVHERALSALVSAVFAAHGCEAAYEPIVTARGEVLHGRAADRRLAPGDLVLCDAGAESPDGYASDVTRTWPVGGWTGRQRAIYDLVLAANEAAIRRCTAGTGYRDVHGEACRVLAAGLVELGLLRGDVDGLVERGAHAAFFPHGTGHLLGLDVHDMELYGDRVGYGPGRARSTQFGLSALRLDRGLQAGMVVTIEPGFYVVPAILADTALRARLGDSVAWDEAERWVGFGGVRIEDDVLITDAAPVVLSAGIPKDGGAIEAAVGVGATAEARLGL